MPARARSRRGGSSRPRSVNPVRELGEDHRSELAELARHPVAQQIEHGEHRPHLRRLSERLLLDLRERLYDRDQETDDQTGEDRWSRDEHGDDQRLARDVDEDAFHQMYPCTRPRTSKSQPSIMMKSRSLNGIDTVVGESMCMPRARRMLEMTMSITRNGKKMRNPIMNASDSSLTVKAGMRTSMSSI